MQSRFYCPSFAYCRFSLRGCRKGPPLPLSSAGGGVYPVRKQFVSRLRSMPSALPIYRRRSSSSGMPEGAAAPSAFFRRRGRVPRRGAIFCSSGRNDLPSSSISSVPNTSIASDSSLPFLFLRDAGRGGGPFRSLPQAGACTPLGNNLSPVCGQRRRRFRFTATVPLPPGMPEGAAAPSALFRRRGRVPRRGAIFCLSGRNDLLSSSLPSVPKTSIASDLPLPFLFLRGCRKGPPPLPLSSADGGVCPAEERFSVCQDATTCRPLLFHPFRKPLPKENRF